VVRLERLIFNTATLLLGFAGLLPFASAGDFKVYTNIGCFSVDGVPVPRNTSFYSRCCPPQDSNDPVCKSGFFNISITSLNDSDSQIDISRDLIKQNQLLNQAANDLANQDGREETGNETPSTSTGSISSALVSGGAFVEPTGKTGKGSPVTGGFSGGPAGGGSGASSGQSGGISGGSGDLSSIRKRKKKSGVTVPGSEEFSGGKYASIGSGPAMVPGSNGPSGVTSSSQGVEVVEYGAAEKDGSKSGDSGSQDGATPAGAGAGAGSGAGGGGSLGAGTGASGSEGSGESSGSGAGGGGSASDAPDYLKRIHAKDSIFRIVSRRYQREVILKNVGVSRRR
jgi:hypothetical protein